MIAVIQRCTRGKVSVDHKTIGEIKHGLVILLGVKNNDAESDADFLAQSIMNACLSKSFSGFSLVEFEKQLEKFSIIN